MNFILNSYNVRIIIEIGRGTSTLDGISIAQAILEHIHDKIGCRTVCATHYHQLGEVAADMASASSYQVMAKKNSNDEILFLYKIFVSKTL